MRKAKAKNASPLYERLPAPLGLSLFIGLWAGSYIASWGLTINLLERIDQAARLTQDQVNIVAISMVLLIAASLQVLVVERLLKRSMRGWMMVSIVGTFVTYFTFKTNVPNDQIILTVLSLLLPVPFFQALWLHRRVQAAWLWVLASLVACAVFALPLKPGNGSSDMVFMWSCLLYGLIQGGIMRFLWLQPRPMEKAKVQFDAQGDTAHDMTQRLTVSERTEYDSGLHTSTQTQTTPYRSGG